MENKEQVERLFKYYREIKQNLNILGHQIANFYGVNDEEVIAGLNFSAPQGERVQTSNISDKPARIASIYRDVADRESEEILRGMIRQHYTQKLELDMFEYCITLLDPRLSSIITDMVINGMTWDEMGEKYFVSQSMLSKYRKKAIKEITRMFGVREVV